MPTSTTSDLKKFAQSARRQLREQVAARLEQVLKTDSAELREREAARRELAQQIAETSKKAVIDRVAYTWFNRFCALRFMDVNRYNRMGVVSPAEGFTQPEILQEAKGGYIDEELHRFVDCQAVFDLLNGRRPSSDPQQEAYRLLLVGTCNALNRAMPFLFEPIADYTELLMPQDLLSEHSILHSLREAMPVPDPGTIMDVEVIGWLYQFYNSERKDEVFEALKKGQKIAAEDIPAATQLYTPHWIVRYLVENSLGRLWMLNRPNSRLVEKMDYYIKPEEPETDFLRITSPEEVKVCDPACGSGHMLTYAFDLLYAIYEEEGYPASDVPRLILEKNLHGIEIDERAGDLAAFALTMKARGSDRRFFGKDVQPNICVLENICFSDQELKEYITAIGLDLFSEPLMQTLKQFEHTKNFGSLIRPIMADTSFICNELERKGLGGNILLFRVHEKVLQVLRQAEFLSSKYHVVVANPPYMGAPNANEELREFLECNYSDFKSDLFSAFIVRNLDLALPRAQLGFMSPFVWMYISSYEKLREFVLGEKVVTSLIQLEYSGFEGATVPICTFTLENIFKPDFRGGYVRLSNFRGADVQGPKALEAIKQPDCGWFYRASTSDFRNIPGCTIAFWLSNQMKLIFKEFQPLSMHFDTKSGQNTGDNNRFIRLWHEINYRKIGFGYKNLSDTINSLHKWYPYNKGGQFRKWYGNREYVINWENDGKEVKEYAVQRNNGKHWSRYIQNLDYMFQEGATWSFISSSYFGVRYAETGSLFDYAGCSLFSKGKINIFQIMGLLCSKLAPEFLAIINPTLNFQPGTVGKIPVRIPEENKAEIEKLAKKAIELVRQDWNSFEFSCDFSISPLLSNNHKNALLHDVFALVYKKWRHLYEELKVIEEKNNEIFIRTYGLENEITPDVTLEAITLTCNPHYRYGGNRSEAQLEALLLADTMREFISYAVGCMFGRYSLDKPGLILANQGETLQDYLRQVPDPTFLPDEDNAIPVLDGEWFSDDITERFKKFLRVTFGEQHYAENLAFIEGAIGRDIRSYFLKEFYSHHVRMYQKRPIYWMFSSPRGSFNVLIYMHRYKPDTISVILNRYLREFRGKLEARKSYLEGVSISTSNSQRERTSALKEIEGLNKTLEEIRVYERDILYPLAVQGIQIDLDDGVKVNYAKFGKALAKVVGLSE